MHDFNESNYNINELSHSTRKAKNFKPVLTENSSLTLILILAIASAVYVCVLITMLIARREM